MGQGRFQLSLIAAAALLGTVHADHDAVPGGTTTGRGLAARPSCSSSCPPSPAASGLGLTWLSESIATRPYPLVLGGGANKWSTPSPDWTAPLPLSVAVEAGLADGTTRYRCAPIGGKLRDTVCNANYGPGNGWQGVASLWLPVDASGHISAGTVRMNDGYLLKAGSTYNHDVVRRHVLCQEVGHTIGLAHQYAVPGSALQNGISCMNDMLSTLKSEAHTVPNGHDWQQLAAIYGSHVDAHKSFARILLRAARRAAAGAAGTSGEESAAGSSSLRGSDAGADAAVTEEAAEAEAEAEAAWAPLVAEVPVRAGATWKAHGAADVEVCLAAALARRC